MNGGTIFILGVIGVVGATSYSMMNHDPMVVDMPVAQVQERLAQAVSTWPSGVGDGVGSIMPVSKTPNGVNVHLKYFVTRGGRNCRINLTAIDDETTRMSSDCTQVDVHTHNADSATERAGNEGDEAFVDEHARSVMAGDTFDFDHANGVSRDALMANHDAVVAEGLDAAH